MKEEQINPSKNTIPYNLDAEIYVISSLILFEDAYDKVTETTLSADDFYDSRNKEIFRVILYLKNSGKPVQLISITETLKTEKVLDKAGGAEYISSIIDKFPTSAYISYYVEIVKKKAMLRKLIHISNEMIAKSYDDPDDVKMLLDEAEKSIMDINQDLFSGSITHIKSVITSTIQSIVNKKQDDGEMSGISSGYFDLDEKTDGFQKSELIIIAARPSVGKTAFALNLLTNIALRVKKSVGFFSCEMSQNSLMVRMLCSEAKVSQSAYRKNMMSAQDRNRISQVAEALYETNVVFDDTPGISILELRSKARKMKREYNIDILFVDYLQLVSFGGELNSSIPRHEQIAYISRSLKSLARELDIPVVALAQLNRNVESRGEASQPKMSDLKDSGSIEQDADVIMFLHRKEMKDGFGGETEPRELIIGKNRNGPTDVIDMVFVKAFTRFQLVTKDYSEE